MTTDYLEIAYAAIPGYQETKTAISRLAAFIPAVGPAVSFDACVSEIVAAADAGGPMPTGLGERLIDSRRAFERADIERKALNEAELRLTGRLQHTVQVGADHGLTALRPHLAEVLDEARTIAPHLAGVRNAQDALDAGADVVAAWQRAGELASVYSAIRQAQAELVRLRFGSDTSTVEIGHRAARGLNLARLLLISGHISNLDQVWPGWKPAPGTARPSTTEYSGWQTPSNTPPWPRDDAEPLQPVLNREYLLWLVTSSAKPWLPTIGEMTANAASQFEAAEQRHAPARGGKSPAASQVGQAQNYTARVDPQDLDDELDAHRRATPQHTY